MIIQLSFTGTRKSILFPCRFREMIQGTDRDSFEEKTMDAMLKIFQILVFKKADFAPNERSILRLIEICDD